MGSFPDAGVAERMENESQISRGNTDMSIYANAIIPSRPASQWPVGMRLRFKPAAALNDRHQVLRGTPVIVLSGLKLIGPKGPDMQYSWRQEVLSFGAGAKTGWARPDQLDLPVDCDPTESF